MTSARRVVVIGGGIIGLSVAYYLTRLQGVTVTLLERDRLAHGSTQFGSGGLRTQFDTPEETMLSLRSRTLWSELEHRHGLDLDFHEVGYLALATDPVSAVELERRIPFQERLGLNIRTVSSDELERLVPGIGLDGVRLARLTPADGYASPRKLAQVLAELARAAGARIQEHAPVRSIIVQRGRVTGVLTDAEEWLCDAVINAAGIWAPTIGEMVGVNFPVEPFYHHQFVTEPLPWMTSTPPCVAELDNSLYVRPEAGGLLFGISGDGSEARDPGDIDQSLLPKLRRKLEQRWPAAANAPINRAWVGPEEMSPDRRPFIGELDEPRGFFYANGFSGHGFMVSLGVGEAVAEIVCEQTSPTSGITSFALDR